LFKKDWSLSSEEEEFEEYQERKGKNDKEFRHVASSRPTPRGKEEERGGNAWMVTLTCDKVTCLANFYQKAKIVI
jgi:hypothetical protein